MHGTHQDAVWLATGIFVSLLNLFSDRSPAFGLSRDAALRQLQARHTIRVRKGDLIVVRGLAIVVSREHLA